MAASFAFTGCQPEEKITHEKHRRVSDMQRILAAIVPESPFAFRVPDGWRQIPPASSFYVLSFVAGDANKQVDINVSMFQGEGGGVLLNVNRWRNQIKLPPLTSDDALPETFVGNAKGKFVDITGPEAPPEKDRIMGAVLIRENNSLFFKMVGPRDYVGRQQSAFEAFLKSFEVQDTWEFKVVGSDSEIESLALPFYEFIRSIRIASPDNPTWTLPQGWIEEKDKVKEQRFLTIHTGLKGKAPEITVSPLQGENAASIPLNVIRWRRQLGLKDNVLGATELEEFCRFEPVGNRMAVVVDMIGPGGGGANMPPLEPASPQPKLPFIYKTPDGWKETRPTSNLTLLAFRAGTNDKKADITVSMFQGESGGLTANVNRWRTQVGLEGLTAAEVNALPDVPIGNTRGKLVDVTGPATPPRPNRIVGAILIRETDSLFFKMTGPSEFVGEQRAAFERFLKSIRFDG
jgi:hypothetical protein